MDVKWIDHEKGHIVEVRTPDGQTKKLPLLLPFKTAVELSSQLEHLKTGAGTLQKACKLLWDALAQGVVFPMDREDIHHVNRLEDICSETPHATFSAERVAHRALYDMLEALTHPEDPCPSVRHFFSIS